MNSRKPGQIITYVPEWKASSSGGEEEAGLTGEMNGLQRAVYIYTNKLGLGYVAVLVCSLIYQALMAFFTGVNALRYLPLLSSLPKEGPGQWLGIMLAVVCGYLLQIGIIFEMAQVVWLRRPDRLRVRLEAQSYWWAIMLVALVVSVCLDFLLLSMSLTATTNLGEALSAAAQSNLTLVLDGLLMLLNVLTLLRCASVMRTSTVEQNRREIEEQIQTIAAEMLLEAGEATQEAAREFWRSLNINPNKFVPLSEAVLTLVAKQFPQFFPEGLGGDTWGYDMNSHAMVVLPPDLHQAFSAARGKLDRIKDEDLRHVLALPPEDLARLIEFNLETYGKPRFVDASRPGEPPTFVYDKANLDAIAPKASSTKNSNSCSLAQELVQSNVVEPPASNQKEFWQKLTAQEKLAFGPFLEHRVYPQLTKKEFYRGAGVPVYEALSLVELQFAYEKWQQLGKP